MVLGEGFEPSLLDPKSSVLPVGRLKNKKVFIFLGYFMYTNIHYAYL